MEASQFKPAPALRSTPLVSREKAEAHRRAWRVLAPAGLIAVGTGASVIGEATLRKGRGEPYVLLGTLGLVALNAGLSLFGEAVRNSTLASLGPPR